MFWYEDDIKSLREKKEGLSEKTGLIFYGSSTIRLWTSLEQDFADYKAINMAFGGSTLAACNWFFETVMMDLQPTGFIIYAGDNDLGDGRHPEEIYLFFKQLVAQIRSFYGTIPVIFISIKPSPARQNIIKSISYANQIINAEIKQQNDHLFYIDVFNAMINEKGIPIKDYFTADGLHMNEKGYAVWRNIIKQVLELDDLKSMMLTEAATVPKLIN